MINIKTSSVKTFLEVKFNKNISLITEDDLLSIDTLAIEGNSENIDLKDLILFPNLKELNISRVELTTQNMNDIKEFQNIESVSFNKCMFIEENDLSMLSNLRKLSFNNCYIENYEFLKNLKQIETLSIANPYNSAIIDLNFLNNAKDLEYLILDKNEILNFSSLINNNKIKYLSLLWTKLPDDYVTTINQMPNLRTLFISPEYNTPSIEQQNLTIYNNLSQFVLEPLDEEQDKTF